MFNKLNMKLTKKIKRKMYGNVFRNSNLISGACNCDCEAAEGD